MVERRGFLKGSMLGAAGLALPAMAGCSPTPPLDTTGVFTHGVASGDPHADSVVLWTRVQVPPTAEPVEVRWSIGTEPTVAETLPGFEAVLWMALFAPAATPAPVIDRLARALNTVTQDRAYQQRMAGIGLAVESGGPADVRALLAADTLNWRKVITDAGIRSN